MTGRAHDVVVIGGGPVGLGAALHAAAAGLSTVVLEPRTGPVDKACGEGLMPGALQSLSEVGAVPNGYEFHGIRYVAGTRSCEARFAHGPGLGVRRTRLHQALSGATTRAGIEVMPVAADSLHQSAHGVDVRTAVSGGGVGPLVTGRYVLAVDGLHSPTRRSLGLDRPAPRRRRYGQRRHYTTPPWTSHVEVHWGPDAEAYVTPVGEGLVGVAVLSRRRDSFDSLLQQFPALRERLAGAAPASRVRGAGPLRQRSARRVAGRVLLVGDAAGYVDALTGEGISVGLAQARAAVSAVVRDSPASYERGWRRASWRYGLLTEALLGSTTPQWGRRLIVPAAGLAPAIFAAAVNELGRPR